MKEYDFTLRFRLGNPFEDAGKYLEILGKAGCDDALVGVGQNGRVSLHFIREAGFRHPLDTRQILLGSP